MPRPPKDKNNPLRQVRQITGLSQADFAKLVGVSKDTIQSVENWRLRLSLDVAHKIRYRVGCFITRKKEKDGSVTYGVTTRAAGLEFTRETFEQRQKVLRNYSEEDLTEE